MKRNLLMIVAVLMLNGMLFAQSYHWTAPNSSLFDYRNHITYQVKIDGELQASDAIEVAAFIGDEVRGVVRLIEPYPQGLPGEFYTYLTVFANQSEIGQTVTMKAYDHDSDMEYDDCSQTFIFNSEEEYEYGGIAQGYYLEFYSPAPTPTYGPEYPWIPSTSYSGNGMAVTAQIQINGELLERNTWEIGAFCGDECRGAVTPLTDWTDLNMGYFADLNILGNDGDIINFYLYDTENSTIYPGKCFTTVVLVNDTYIGQDVFNDLFVLNFVPAQTFTKQITGYTPGLSDHYYLLASPIGEVSPTDVDKMLRNDFDLYYFDQAQALEWINYEGSEGDFNLEAGKGYLYANSADVTLTFTGYPYSGDGTVTLDKTDGAIWDGWNLVGNPFAETAYIEKDFYRMNAEGTNLITPDPTEQAIAAMEGVFVVAESDGETLTFTTEEPQGKGASLVMNITRNTRGNAVDRAIIRFDGERNLPKFTLNERSTKLYIPQDNKDYAVINANKDGEMPIYFKAAENGTYNLDFSRKNVDFSYLHLIDNITGNDIDLLINPSYSFDARTTDYASRFRLVFSAQSNNNEHFAFISNGQIILTGVDSNATIQVIDALGRVVVSRNAGGQSISTKGMTAGVYVLRLIEGNETRTQKIIIK